MFGWVSISFTTMRKVLTSATTGPVTAAATAPAAIRLRGGSDHQAAHQGSDHNCNQSPLATTLAAHRNHCAP